MTDVPTTVPLPDHLLDGSCGCQHATHGRHNTWCLPARAYDDAPIEVGKRYRCVSWEYPLAMTMDVRVRLEVDPVAYILANLDSYLHFTPDPSYQAWEKPMCFLATELEEECDVIGHMGHISGRRAYVARVTADVDLDGEHPPWTPEHTERLDAAIANRTVDPNQGTLL